MVGFHPQEPWIRSFKAAGETAVRLVCFPHAGGSASFFFPWAKELTGPVELLAVQYPGRQDRAAEPCVDNIPELADRVFEALHGLEGAPFAFFGHSMGSILAFEVARRFQEKAAAAPVRLFASGYPAPSRLRGGSIHRRDDAGLVDELRASGGTDPRGLQDAELLAMILPPLRADYAAIETHARDTETVLTCPITMLTGNADHHTTLDEAWAWRSHTSGHFELAVYDGGHFFIEPHRADVTGLISARLGAPTEGER